VSPETFCVFGYEGKAKIVLKDKGTGSPYACIDDMDESQVYYALLRITYRIAPLESHANLPT
jgi:hypothetical protein